ncbi:hypothetical protein SAMN05444320_104504 [Streptoalloteichus hindustanus]|uniref:VOC domain-containing protein n=2 Tax=Streptoalloteichus hindustanus TaxID=2017 RepID=A0A1M5DLL0_STRHI|nr:hypothetical protein SAMN05444320_104504 [Streptoalloteichus hindustanus]
MSSRLATIVISAVNPEAVADFWCAVLGWSIIEREHYGLTIGGAEASWPTIGIYAVPEAKAVKNRLHLDLRADGLSTSDELDRLLALGARRVDVGQPSDVDWVVLADPEGNEFCLLSEPVVEVSSA